MKNIIITIPAYNEEETIGYVIQDIKKTMQETGYHWKILVVSDGSRDRTNEIAKKLGAAVYIHNYRRGLAEVFRSEMQECLRMKAEIIVHIDADGQYDAKDIPRLIAEVEKGYDLVLGNRFRGGIEEMPVMKKIGNRAFSKVISNILKYPVGDCQTGFRAFTQDVAQLQIISNYSYTQEQIIRAVKENFRVKEIPTHFGKRIAGTSRLMSNPFAYALRAWINIIRLYRDYNPLSFFGRIGCFSVGLGILVGVCLVILFIFTGKVGHVPLTIFSILLIIIGIQIISIGFLADMIKNRER